MSHRVQSILVSELSAIFCTSLHPPSRISLLANKIRSPTPPLGFASPCIYLVFVAGVAGVEECRLSRRLIRPRRRIRLSFHCRGTPSRRAERNLNLNSTNDRLKPTSGCALCCDRRVVMVVGRYASMFGEANNNERSRRLFKIPRHFVHLEYSQFFT